MAESRRIKFYTADDWVWVFADDRCVFSGHSVTGADLLEALEYEDFSKNYVKDGLPEDALWSVDESSLSSFPTDLFE